MHSLGHFLLAGVIFVVIDSVWITVVANKFYKAQIGKLLLDKPKFGPAVLFYLIYLLALVVFIINPALQTTDWDFLWRAALLGVTMYATYDLTNLSTLKDWSSKMTVVDMAWGTFVTTAVSLVTVAILR